MKTDNTNMKITKSKTVSNRKDKKWLRNPDQRKNPKYFSIKMLRLKDGSFHILGGESKYLNRINQHANEWVNVDTRDLATELRNYRIGCF